METIIRHVRDMDTTERSTLEQLLGQRLRENQQLIIQVMTLSVPPHTQAPPADALPLGATYTRG